MIQNVIGDLYISPGSRSHIFSDCQNAVFMSISAKPENNHIEGHHDRGLTRPSKLLSK